MQSAQNVGARGFLSDSWRDGLAVSGGIGVIITAVAFLVAIYQVSRATSVAEASSNAAVEALSESRRKYKQYVVSHVSRLISEACIYVKKSDWRLASLRLIDLADLAAQISDEDEQWGDLTGRLRGKESSFERVGSDEIVFSPSLRGKWRKLVCDLSSKITESDRPFPVVEKEKKS